LQVVQQLFKQPFLARQRPLLGGQGLVLEGLELGGDEALGVFEGLSAAVVVGHTVELTLGDLDVKTVHLVELHPQVGDAGAGPFTAFKLQQKAVAVVLNGTQLIELRVKPVGHHTAVTHQGGGFGVQRAQQQLAARGRDDHVLS